MFKKRCSGHSILNYRKALCLPPKIVTCAANAVWTLKPRLKTVRNDRIGSSHFGVGPSSADSGQFCVPQSSFGGIGGRLELIYFYNLTVSTRVFVFLAWIETTPLARCAWSVTEQNNTNCKTGKLSPLLPPQVRTQRDNQYEVSAFEGHR